MYSLPDISMLVGWPIHTDYALPRVGAIVFDDEGRRSIWMHPHMLIEFQHPRDPSLALELIVADLVRLANIKFDALLRKIEAL